jgi:DDE superfamily endonuclease
MNTFNGPMKMNTRKLPKCFKAGIMDGTLFPLAFSPQTKDAPDYSGRKFPYSLSVLIVNDHKKRIRHYLAGFPGYAHDQRVWSHTKLFREPQQYFSPGQYILGDSAFTNSAIVVASFKKPNNGAIVRSIRMLIRTIVAVCEQF